MSKSLDGPELMGILHRYNCQKQINDRLTEIILRSKKESGQLREFLEVTDCRGMFVIGPKYPTLYFEAAFDFRWLRGRKIVLPGQLPEQDKLSIGVVAAEQLTVEEFNKRLEAQMLEKVLSDAKKIINP